jgi:pyruvate dehydrogenase E2 component (dihydrolipoamide acetyltransferase)
MAFQFRLPDIGEGVVEGEVVRWLVAEGDAVKEDQPMVEVMTDKATVEIPSPRGGTIEKIHAAAGKVCKVGAVMVEIKEVDSRQSTVNSSGGQKQTQPPAQTPSAQGQNLASAAIAVSAHANGNGHGAGGKVLATPATRKLARDLGVDLVHVRPTGDNGRITAEDVRGASQGPAATSVAPLRAPVAVPTSGADRRIPFRGVRKKIAENMHRSRQTAAHFTYVEECDVTELVALRARAKARAEERGIKLSFLPFIVKAVCAGLKKHPICNATLDEAQQEIVLRSACHIGVAAATAEGLIVPVIRDADQRSLFDLARTLDELSERARTGKAAREEITGSTFTISSLGAIGGVLATPIINFPEVAILGVHKMKPMPVVRDGQIVIREMMNLSISLDHRVVDGFEGAQFLKHVIGLLEDPTLMFMEMV